MKRELKTIVSVKNLKGSKFVGVQNYTSKTGEVSNYTFIANIDYQCAKDKDIETLETCDLSDLNTFPMSTYQEARESLLNGLKKPNKKAMPYVDMGNGLKLNEIDNSIHIEGLLVRKKTIVSVEKKPVKSSDLTLAREEIKKYLKLRTPLYRTFKVGSSEVIKVNGKAV